MAISGSPSIVIKEEDRSTYVLPASTTVGALVGDFEWGPAFEAQTVSNEGNLVKIFGKPVDRNYKDWFVAANFLTYSGALRVVRVVDEESKNASDVLAGAVQIKNDSHFTSMYGSLSGVGKTAKIFARCPGTFGNTLKVVISDKVGLETEGNLLMPYVSKTLNDNDVALGVFINNELVEFGMYSFDPNSKDMSGYPNYIITAVNRTSKYVYLIESTLISYTESVRNAININTTLVGGTSVALTDAEYTLGWNLFKNADIEEVSLLLQGGASATIGGYMITSVADFRKDCVACVSPMLTDVVNAANPITSMKATYVSYAASSYRFGDGNYKYQFDAYNDTYRWVPCNGDTAGLMALTDVEERPWFSPAGKTIRNCVKLAFYPDKAQRDEMYVANINPVTAFKEEGHVLYGDWTGVDNSAFNFINVRRCFIYMEKSIATAARKIMWKQNDAITQTQFVQFVEPFLRDVQGGRGISEYKIFADSSVNTPDIMDQGLFVAKIAVKPIRSIRWIELTFIASRSDVSFEELVA